MKEQERALARRDLDHAQRWFRRAERQNPYRLGWLRDLRQALGIPVAELTRKLGVNSSVLYRLEKREKRGRISLGAMNRMAKAMGCEVIYSIVPQLGKTLVELAEQQAWEKRLKSRE